MVMNIYLQFVTAGWEKNVKDDGNYKMKQSLEPSLKVQMELDQHEAECAFDMKWSTRLWSNLINVFGD